MLLSIGMLMLSATQVYTILTVQLFAFLNLLPVEADILAYNFENASQTFDDLPARFGYRLPTEGLKGFLINSKPENACEPIVPPPVKDNSSGTFIVLIRRLDCNFDIKVLNAQRAGYKAAIVHNVDSDDLISMGSNDIEVLKKIDIPSVFIGESSANSLKDEFTYEKGGHIILVPEFSLPLEYYLIPFLIIVGICLILIVIFMITKFVQDRHRARRNRLRKDQLKKLPVHKFKKASRHRRQDMPQAVRVAPQLLPWELHSAPQHQAAVASNCVCEHLCFNLNLCASVSKMCPKEMSMTYVPFVWMNMKMETSSESFPVLMLITASV
nr:E3 ubiquitin-protein ligase RNF13 isoform X2 [Camelus dromedarius]